MKTQEFLDNLRGDGRYSFTLEEAEKSLALSRIATLNALHRLKRSKAIVTPAKGFYLIVPPEYQAFGCLPAEMFIADFMKYINQPYYVGFLSAAQFYGAAHQKPQRTQIVTSKERRPIRCGRIYIQFIRNKNIAQMPTKTMNTYTGYINVATPEVTAADLVSAPKHGAGISNVATVLIELAESLDEKQLLALTKIRPQLPWIQRLGYLLDFLNLNQFSDVLLKALQDKKVNWTPLVSRSSDKILSRNKKWKIIVNTEVEPDDI
jgi:predicted transcriptional regulator of viral defense system